jgi:hypothetical protein
MGVFKRGEVSRFDRRPDQKLLSTNEKTTFLAISGHENVSLQARSKAELAAAQTRFKPVYGDLDAHCSAFALAAL